MVEYRTSDFYCTAFLVAQGLKPVSHKREGQQMVFLFDSSPALDDMVESYYGLRASVNPVAYGNAIRTLKSIVHANSDKGAINSHVTQLRKAQ